MADPTLDADLSAYLARPITGDRRKAEWKLSSGLIDILQRLAQERGVPPDVLVEYALFKAVRADKARRLVGEPPDLIPASFQNDLVADAKVSLEKDRAALQSLREERGDKASRIAGEMEAALKNATAPDEHLEAVQRKAALSDAMLDQALKKRNE
jgi:hypothetical protein